MTSNTSFRLYTGTGETLRARGIEWQPSRPSGRLSDPANYVASPGLRDAVNVALALQHPLLLTGEPGTGKTELASSLAYELNLPAPLVFNTKTSSVARDLFYRYDSLARFHDAQFKDGKPQPEKYIEFQCLGLAILLANGPGTTDPLLPSGLRGKAPTQSVVLIDEIDKAPRDLPNDILNEIERMQFTVRETGQSYAADPEFHPIVILTSNSEKTLPDAFLRRCVFYHIPFPAGERLAAIVQLRLSGNGNEMTDKMRVAVEHFETLRALSLRKPPATAELLAWLRIIERLDIDINNLKLGEKETLALSYSVLAKSKEDLATLREHSPS